MAKIVLSLKARALRYLSMREHSRLELARKLSRYAQEGDDIETLLDSLAAAKLLSDARFCESLVHRRAARFGNSRIISELHSHGIDRESLDLVKSNISGSEVERARAIWCRKFGELPKDAAERAKQMRFLAQRGFSTGTIRTLLKGEEPDN